MSRIPVAVQLHSVRQEMGEDMAGTLAKLDELGYDGVELVAGLNRYACAHSLRGLRFTTAFLAEFDPRDRRLVYVNAGHNAPILRRVASGVERLEATGFRAAIHEAVAAATKRSRELG